MSENTVSSMMLHPAASKDPWDQRFRTATGEGTVILVADTFYDDNRVVARFDNPYTMDVNLRAASICAAALNQDYWLAEGINMITALERDAAKRTTDQFDGHCDWLYGEGDDMAGFVLDKHLSTVIILPSLHAAEIYLMAADAHYRTHLASLKALAGTALVC